MTGDLPVGDSVLGSGMIDSWSLWKRYFKEIINRRLDDIIVISYPKSGRTWHRVMLSHYVSAVFLNQEAKSLSTGKLTSLAGLPRISYSHNGANFTHAIPPDHPLVANGLLWRRRKIVLLTRDPRDVLVSAYMHARNRSNSFTGTISEFVRHRYTGIEKILVAHQRWDNHRRLAKAVLIQSYEKMHEEPVKVLQELLMFAGIKVEPAAIANAVEFARFENLQSRERSGYFDREILRSTEDNADALKVRSGKVGGYSKHLTSEDLRFIEGAMSRIGYPFPVP